MASAIPAAGSRSSRPPQSSAARAHLLGYNFLSAILWASVLGRVVLLASLVGWQHVFAGTGEFAKWTQTMALMEVVHSVFGLVRASIMTTLIQVASRILLVWPVFTLFPGVVASSPACSTMLVSWSITEVIRYSYFVFVLGRGSVPEWLEWLRYNTFFVLYPMGISSECWLLFKSADQAAKMNSSLVYGLYAILAIYVPGSYILYTHMMVQRKKIMRAKRHTA
ncbi:tyrosine phosphatase-like protein [Lineolata rhizophorae]|uniref:Very-long-chain (3R)-3-hydroxyacyl-CoA dehydratase n=1 Tax=Lineolata rhizophorae TaxID=578093 RepID=A0A6A6NN10_9PEZI|nr:tyrosine phosphatase-like protein [Lineolata rhizophorae]